MKIRSVGFELLQSVAMIMVGFRIFDIALIRTANTNTDTNTNTQTHIDTTHRCHCHIC